MFIHFIGTWRPYSYVYVSKAITIVYSYVFQVIDVLSKLAGLWVNSKNEIMYSQASQITFICPMIFNYFPLDTQVRKKAVELNQNASKYVIFASFIPAYILWLCIIMHVFLSCCIFFSWSSPTFMNSRSILMLIGLHV